MTGERPNGMRGAGPEVDRLPFSGVLDHAPVMLRWIDPSGSSDQLDPGWLRFVGGSLEEGSGMRWRDHLHPADLLLWMNVHATAVEARRPYTVDYRLMRQDGVYRWIMESAEPVYDRAGTFQGHAASCVDVSVRKYAEQGLNVATEAGKLGVWDWNIVADTIAWTDAVYGIHGVEKGAFIPTLAGYSELIHPEDRARTMERIQAALNDEAGYETEFRVLDRSGRSRWVFTNATVLRENGKPVRMLGSTMDITDRKAMEMELQRIQAGLNDQVSALTRLHELALALPGIAGHDVSLGRILDTLVELHGADHGLIGRYDEADQGLSVLAVHALPADLVRKENSRLGAMLNTRERSVVLDTESADDLSGYKELGRRSGFRSVHSVPVLDHDARLIGELTVMFREPGRTPNGLEEQWADLCARYATEVMEHVRNVHALRARDERFTRFMEHLRGHAWIKGADDRYVFVNEAVAGMLGKSPADVVGRTDAELFAPEVAARHSRSDAEVREKGRGVQTVDFLDRLDGTYHSLVSKFLIPDPKGGEPLIGGIAIDISEQLRVEEVLRESEERFHLLADNMAQLVWIGDAEGKPTWFNRRFYAYTGLDPARAVEDAGLGLLHPDHVQRVMARRQEAHERGQAWEETFPLRGADGGYRWFLMRSIPVHSEEGKLVRWFGTNTDITEQKDAQDRLTEADHRKDEFLAILAHELRNPLAPLRNGMELLSLPGVDAETAERTRRMMDRQLWQMVRLVDDLMDVSRITRGAIELRNARQQLRSVLEMAVETSRPLIQAHGHRLEMDLPNDPMPVHGDAIRLAQIFSNLLNNAAKYTRSGGVIRVQASLGNGSVVVRVEDNGIGIGEKDLPRVFDMFTQLDHERKGVHGSLGIGLSIVQRLVGMHQGSIEAHSEGLGRGSRFTVTLPLLQEQSGEPVVEQSGSQASTHAHVLVVDDNEDAAYVLGLVLRKLGHRVSVAHGGVEALSVVANERPDVVLMDIGMPGMNGYETCRKLRDHPNTRNAFIVALTGWGQEEDKRNALRAGFDKHLVKPIDQTGLVALLRDRPVSSGNLP